MKNPESVLFLQIEMEPALLACLGDNVKSRRLGQFDEMGTTCLLGPFKLI
jgi:hypothetical protein